jgi:hypothetical protein
MLFNKVAKQQQHRCIALGEAHKSFNRWLDRCGYSRLLAFG